MLNSSKKNFIKCELSAIFLSMLLPFFSVSAQEIKTPSEIVYLNQAWSAKDRANFYWKSQGSALLSYDIYLALTLPGTNELFNSRSNSDRMGLLLEPINKKVNPDDLPVGIAKSVVTSGTLRGTYAGLTCAACHTNQIQYKGSQIRIDGGNASRFDLLLWLQTLSRSVDAPLNDPALFASLVSRIRERTPVDEVELKARLNADAEFIRLQLNESVVVPHAPGPGRTDAFTEESNTVIAIHTGISENARPALAPIKPPFLWNTPQSAWVEWSGVAINPLLRNFSEVLGVFARYDLSSSQKNFNEVESTIDLKGLIEIEQSIRRLAPPAWPENILGNLDPARVKDGANLFQKHCIECHTAYPYRWSAPRAKGVRMIENAMVPQNIVGTDKQHLLGILFNQKPSILTKHLADKLQGKSVVTAGELFAALEKPMIEYALKQSGPFTPDEILDMNGFIDASVDLTPPVNSYKAAPRDGAWSTAPFLHNGSIPNMYELLSPQSERSKTFYINREFDPVKLGLDTEKSKDGFLFDTSLIGNSNEGHLFAEGKGPGIIGPELTPNERFALIEYLKSIPEVPGRVTPFGGPENPLIADQDPSWFNTKHPYGRR
jgi:hypothetical protein